MRCASPAPQMNNSSPAARINKQIADSAPSIRSPDYMINGLVHVFLTPFRSGRGLGPGTRSSCEPPDRSRGLRGEQWVKRKEKRNKRPNWQSTVRAALWRGVRIYQTLVSVAKNEWRKESSGTFDALMSRRRDHCEKCVGNVWVCFRICVSSHILTERWKTKQRK